MARVHYAEDICDFLGKEGGWWLARQIFDDLWRRYRERKKEPPSFWRKHFPRSWDYWHRPTPYWLALYLSALCEVGDIVKRERVESPPQNPPRMEYALTPRGAYRKTRIAASRAAAKPRAPRARPRPAQART